MYTKLFYIILFMSTFFYSKANETISYVVEQSSYNQKPALKVFAKFQTSRNGVTNLNFPSSMWGEESLKNHFKNFRTEEDSEILFNESEDLIQIKHADSLNYINVSYLIISSENSLEIDFVNYFRPFISKERFHILSFSLFVTSSLSMNPIYDIDIHWKNFNKYFLIHNSFNSNITHQNIKGIERDKFNQSVFIGGDYKLDEFFINDKKIVFASPVEWENIERNYLLDLVTKVIKIQRKFWDDYSQDYYTTILTPLSNYQDINYIGAGLTNSFMALIGDSSKIGKDDILNLINHELLHNWIGVKIENKNEEKQYWFSEGFTEYYHFKLASKNCLSIQMESFFIKKINEFNYLLNSSQYNEIKNDELNYDSFWNNEGIEEIPYWRGALFAFYLDLSIRNKSDNKYSLDDLMFDILNDATNNNQTIDKDYFVKVASNYYGKDFGKLFDKHIVNGELIPLDNLYDRNKLSYSYQTSSKGVTYLKLLNDENNLKIIFN